MIQRIRALSAMTMALALSIPQGAPPAAAAAAETAEVPDRTVADAIGLLEVWIGEQLSYHGVPGLSIAVVHDQELVWSEGYGFCDLETKAPAARETPYRIGSISKVFTSTAILQLRDRGKLRLDDPVADYLPWFGLESDFPGAPEITIRHLLTHTAGLPREGAFPYWTTHDFPTRDELKAAVTGQAAVFAPEVTYKYSNLGMAMLGEVVAAASEMDYADYVEKHLFGPLGMSASAVFPNGELLAKLATPYMIRLPDGSRNVHNYYSTRALAPAAEIVSTVVDLAKFAALHLHDGSSAAAEAILKAASAREMQRPHWVYPGWNGGRGLGFGISRRSDKTVVSHGGWIGGNRAHLLLVPSEKIAVVAMTNADDAAPHTFSFEAYDVLGPAIAKAVGSKPAAETFDPSWERFVGVYTDPWGWKEEVRVLDGKLIMYSYSYPPDEDADGGVTPLTHVEGNAFKRPGGELVVFELAEDGTVARLKKRYEYLQPVDR